MRAAKTDRAWERYGEIDAYFGVLNEDRFRRGALTDDARREFFKSGEEHVALVLSTIRQRLDSSFSPVDALDFGCGVGRIAIPLARACQHVVGVDVAPKMLEEAQRNCGAQGVGNVTFELSDDELTSVTGRFDLIHSFIVFQHIRPSRGEALLKAMIARLNENGVGALHFTYGRRAPRLRKVVHSMRKSLPLVNNLVNLVQGRPIGFPMMEMNNYNLSRIFGILQDNGCGHSYVRFTDHGGHWGVFVFFQKTALPAL